jgi:hypothetical protein
MTAARRPDTEPATQQLPAVTGHPIPGVVLDIDVADPIPAIPATRAGRRMAAAWVLVRAFTEPVGQSIVEIPSTGLTATALAARIDRDFGPTIRQRVRAAGGDPTRGVPVDGVQICGEPPYLASRAAVLTNALPITVVVCTRERPVQLRACLESLLGQAYPYPAYRILVVDSAPCTEQSRAVVREFQRRFHVDYLREERPGRSRARNAAVAAAPGEVLAFVDDDVLPDRFWLAELARGFAELPTVDVLQGTVLPAELETPAQVWFARYGGRGQDFTPAPISLRSLLGRRPMPPPGTGATLAFRPGVIEAIGGFDEALGAGTPAAAAEETLALLRVLRAGGSAAYRPAALVRRRYRRDVESLRRQLLDDGTALAAACTSLVCRDPRALGDLLRATPGVLRGVGDVLRAHRDSWAAAAEVVSGDVAGGVGAGRHRAADAADPDGGALPAELARLVWQGAWRGPAAYLRGLALARRQRHEGPERQPYRWDRLATLLREPTWA